MRKKKTTVGMLLVTGSLILVGTGILKYQMSQVQASRQVSTVERKEPVKEDSILATVETANIQDETEPKVLLEDKNIYIPKSAIYEGVDRWGYHMTWNGYSICYSKYGVAEKESDMSIGEAISIAKDTVLCYGKQDVSGATVEISLSKNGLEGLNEWYIDNTQYYGIRYYYICFRDVAEHVYTVRLNALTGQVFGYFDWCSGSVSEAERYSQELESAEDIYYPLAKTFIQEDLKLGKVEKCYGTTQMMMGEGDRPALLFHCETEDGDVINISFDQSQKMVNGFSINPLTNDSFE